MTAVTAEGFKRYCPECNSTIDRADVDSCHVCGHDRPDHGYPEDPRIGSLVAGDQYRVIRRIGAGGFGVVYEVETMVGGLRRALKVLGRRWAESPEVQERFINEALVLEQVNHPNVARCFVAGRLDDGQLYLLFELIDGVQLAKLIRDAGDGGLEPMRAVRLAKQVAAGLKAAHEAQILHRDLKPDNILVVDAGTPAERVKIVDFGIAKLLDIDEGSTSTQSIVGTPEFMPPEQFLPGTPLDSRVDVWQLGATLFASLTGQAPYSGKGGMAAIMAQQAKRELGPAPSEVAAELSQHGALDNLVSRMLATDPEHRPSSAAVLCEELARVEHAITGTQDRRGFEPLLEALCFTPSASAWNALQGYLSDLAEPDEAVIATAEQLLGAWPEALRAATNAQWEAVRRTRAPAPRWALVRSLDLSGRALGDGDLEALANNPALAGITRLDLSRNQIGNAGLAALADSPHAAELVHLDLSHNQISSQGLELLARRWAGGLRSLRLAANGVGARGVRALASSSLRLHALDLSRNEISDAAVLAIAGSDSLVGLRNLGLAATGITHAGVAALLTSPTFSRLVTLDLSDNDLGTGAGESSAYPRDLRPLRTLRLARNALGRDGLERLIGAALLDNVRDLDVSGNRLGPSGVMLLARTPAIRGLARLDLSDNDLGDAGLAAFIGSAHIGGLRDLGVARNAMSASGAGLLADAPLQLERLDLTHNAIADAEPTAEALGRLRVNRLSVAGCGFDGDGIARLLAATRLVELDISRNPLGRDGAAALAAAEGLRSVELLAVAHCELGAEGMLALARSPHLGNLRSLDVSSNRLEAGGVNALVAAAPRVPHLETLIAEDNDIDAAGAESLTASPLARHLCALHLGHNKLGDHGAEVISQGSSWHALRALELPRNELSLAGVAALATSPRMAALQRLHIADNPLSAVPDVYALSDDSVALLEQSFAAIQGLGADFAEMFYEELFARFPGVKPLFAEVPMRRQYTHLMNALALVIDNLRTPEVVERAIAALGTRHMGYGVAPSHYYAVKSTLLDTMARAAKGRWSETLAAAWSDALDAVSNGMMSAPRPKPAAAAATGAGADAGNMATLDTAPGWKR